MCFFLEVMLEFLCRLYEHTVGWLIEELGRFKMVLLGVWTVAVGWVCSFYIVPVLMTEGRYQTAIAAWVLGIVASLMIWIAGVSGITILCVFLGMLWGVWEAAADTVRARRATIKK